MEMLMENVTKAELVELIKQAVNQSIESHPLSSEEIQWVRLAIQAEVERAELRKAIINKTLTGLVWILIVAAGGWLLDYVASHWK
jgi:DNA-binding transcriptional regulator YdaS (Cro superfamily)